MNKHWGNIFKQTKTAAKAAMLPWLSVAFLFLASPDAYAGPNDVCKTTDTAPDITTTAQCEKESCDTKPGCLDPAPVKPATRFSSTPGQRAQSYGPDGKPVGSTGHKGNDIAAPMNSPIYAAADGEIIQMGHQMNEVKRTGWGNYIKIQHKDGTTQTLYAHMNCFAQRVKSDGSVITLKNGSEVKKGQVIGFVGMTGGTSGPHLHYEIIKDHVAYNATLEENEKSGLLCEIPKKFVSAEIPPDGAAAGGGNAGGNCGGSVGGGVSDGNCAKMYPADDLADLHHKYESSGDTCAFNKCAAGDVGSCSYGSSQLACGPGSMKEYLTYLQKSSPQIWSSLGGGSVADMNAKACTPPATEFAGKWASLCSSGQGDTLKSSQSKYMESQYLTPALNSVKKNYGIDFDGRSPELQMAIYSTAVQHGSPGGVNSIFTAISQKVGDPSKMSDTDLLNAIYNERPNRFGSSAANIQAAVKKRFVNENAEVQESLKIRKAWEEEQKKTPHKTYEELVKELTGKDACAGGKSGSFNCTPGGGSTGGGATSTETFSERPGKNCAPSQYSSTMKDCLFCPLFKVIFDTASLMAKLSFNKLAIPVMSVVLVAWAIWIAMTVLKFVSAIDTKDAPTMIKELLGKSIVVLIVVLFLQADSSTFFQMALEPIFNTGFKLAQLAVADGACTKEFGVMKDGGLPPSMGNSILCTIQAVQDRLVNTMALGSSSMCVGWYIKAKLVIFGSFAYIITGLLIWAGCLVMMVVFPFLMLDSIFQLTVACALLPAAIGCYPFKATNGYVKTIWNSFINAMFNFIFLSIVILILTEAIDVTLGNSVYNSIDKNDMDKGGYMEVIVTALAWSGIALLKIVSVLLLGWVVLDEISGFAGQFAGGISTGGIGRQVGGMAASGAQKIGGKAWKSAKTVGGAVGENVKEAAGDWNRERKMNNVTKNGKAVDVTDKEGNVIGQKFVSESKSWFRGRNKTNEVTVKGSMKDGVFVADKGTKMLVSSKDYGNGKIVTTKSDGFLKQTETSVNGKVTGGEISITSAGLKSIRNRDGTMNTTALNAAIRGSAFDEKIVMAAAMQEYAKKSFPGVTDGFHSTSGIGKFNGSLDKADITLVQNEKGQQVLQVTEKGEGGESKVMRMTMGENGRPLLEVENTASDGRFLSHSTDGMFNRITEASVDLETGKKSGMRSQYSVSDYYAKQTKYPVDESGRLSSVFGKGEKNSFSDEELAIMRQQFVNDRRRGQPHTIAGIL